MADNWIDWKIGDGELKTHPLSFVDAIYSQRSCVVRCYAYNVCVADYSGLVKYRVVQEHPTTNAVMPKALTEDQEIESFLQDVGVDNLIKTRI